MPPDGLMGSGDHTRVAYSPVPRSSGLEQRLGTCYINPLPTVTLLTRFASYLSHFTFTNFIFLRLFAIQTHNGHQGILQDDHTRSGRGDASICIEGTVS